MNFSDVGSKKPNRILMISARSDIGGGPGHMWALAQGVVKSMAIYAALPSDGVFFEKFVGLVGAGHVFTIPRQELTLKALWGLRRFCLQNQVSLIHSHGKGAGLYSRIVGVVLGIPVVHTLHGYHDGRYASFLKGLYALWEGMAGFFTKKIICVSESEASLFKRKVFVQKYKLIVIPNGTDIQQNVVEKLSPRKVVTVARFDYQKNLLELLRVAQRLPDYDFFVIGDGADRSQVEAEITALQLKNVRLCGASNQVVEDIADADVYLTTARWEGLPLAVLEAMSLGMPVVASDVVGNRDAVKEGVTGFLYPLGNVELAVNAIQKAHSLNRTTVREYHRAHFSSERMVNQTLRAYQQVIGF